MTAALTAITAVAWIALSGVVLAFLASWAGPRRAITDVNGSWQLWVVGTQATAIAATSAYTVGVLPGRVARVPPIHETGTAAAWIAAAVWATVFIWMTGSTAVRLRARAQPAGAA